MRFALITLATCLVVLPAPALAGDPITVPPEWEGIWALTQTVTTPCITGVPQTFTDTDTLCAGDELFEDETGGMGTFECTGTVTSTTVDVTCTSVQTFDIPRQGMCTITSVTEYDGTRSGDTYMVDGETNTTVEGPKLCGQNSCTSTSVTGTRTDPSPDACKGMPIEGRSWGQVKAEYR